MLIRDKYLFKAKRLDNGEWVYGYYAVIGGREVIIKDKEEKLIDVNEGLIINGNEIVPIISESLCAYERK